MSDIEIDALTASPDIRDALSEHADRDGGEWRLGQLHASAGAGRRPTTFWRNALAAAARGERIVLGAFDGDALVGTVTLLLDLPPNQPHRAEIAKMMTRISHRGRGVATALMRAAEAIAVARGRALLVLDTAEDDGAAGLYERLGFQLTGDDSRLRAEAAWRPDRHDDLLEAAAGSRTRLS